MREQLKMLKHHANPRTQLGELDLRIADHHTVHTDPALLKRLEAVDRFYQRGFS